LRVGFWPVGKVSSFLLMIGPLTTDSFFTTRPTRLKIYFSKLERFPEYGLLRNITKQKSEDVT
jgi:hypothetical protein